jgi:hypothetical protein
MDGDRIVHLLRWHQVQTEAELGEALKQIKAQADQRGGLDPRRPSAAVCRVRWGLMDLETRLISVSPGASSAGLLPLQEIPP